eukprot:TRINITY_DN2734_c0_g1_i1.p1 TRINITY_DN2734_c0_g1~~TRINITY_DN2734_c0_g1_i1.p1  ORF type:complete len:203 (+),score=40.41 TRINITY_DN2734_c0_g1_i1:61-609(+)
MCIRDRWYQRRVHGERLKYKKMSRSGTLSSLVVLALLGFGLAGITTVITAGATSNVKKTPSDCPASCSCCDSNKMCQDASACESPIILYLGIGAGIFFILIIVCGVIRYHYYKKAILEKIKKSQERRQEHGEVPSSPQSPYSVTDDEEEMVNAGAVRVELPPQNYAQSPNQPTVNSRTNLVH